MDMNAMMSDPRFLAALNMFAQTGYQPNSTALSRVGAAGINTARQLQQIERASETNAWKRKSMEIAEERNRIAQEMNRERLRLQERGLTQSQKQHEEEMAMYNTMPIPLEGGGWWSPGGRVQGASPDPMKQLMASMMGSYANTAPGGPQSQMPYTPAPPAAIEYLKQNPSAENQAQFRAKYGYIPRY